MNGSQAEISSHSRKSFHSTFQLGPCVSGGHLRSNAGFSLRNNGKRKTDDIDSFLQHRVCHTCGQRGIAEHYGGNWVFAGLNAESVLRHCRPDVCSVLPKLFSQLIRLAEQLQCTH